MGFHTKMIGALSGLAFVASGPAQAAIDTTDPFEGLTVTYTDVDDSPDDPELTSDLYGTIELLGGDLLDFDPVEAPFTASSPPASTTDGALSFLVTSNDGSPIPALIVTESGDYSFLGLTPDSAVVSATLFVDILDADTEMSIFGTDGPRSSTFSALNEDVPVDNGFWTNEVVIDLSGFDLTEFEVIINNTLQAAGPPSTAASIRKKNFQVDVPEPGTLALLLGGAALLTLRRKAD